MPRPNQPRAVAYEATMAARIRQEREARNLTYERLAEKLTEAGCPIQGSAIFKIENGDPPRRITLDEALTFAHVFGIKLHALLVPASVAASKEALALWDQYETATKHYLEARERLTALEARIVALAADDHAEAVVEALQSQHGDDALQTLTHMRMFQEHLARAPKSQKGKG